MSLPYSEVPHRRKHSGNRLGFCYNPRQSRLALRAPADGMARLYCHSSGLSPCEDALDVPRQNNPAPRLEIAGDLYGAMIAHVQHHVPEEACGLIAFDGRQRAVKLFPGTNVEHSRTRYRMDLDEVIDALSEMEAQGWDLGAIFHSHPETSAEPSATDLQYAYYPNALMVIISLAGKDPEVRAFRVDGAVREVTVKVLDEPNGVLAG